MSRECKYCGEDVPETEYADHLRRAHSENLTKLDQRRLGITDEDAGRNRTFVVGASIIGIAVVVGYVLLFVGIDDTGPEAELMPDAQAGLHEHGTLSIEQDGEAVDFSDPDHTEQDACFHFHEGDGEIWHTHCEDVTLEYALSTLGMPVTDTSIEIDDTEYSDDDPDTSVSVTVDGQPVDPSRYVLDGAGPTDAAREGEGDNVRIVVETEG